MRAGRGSTTAVWVCKARALASRMRIAGFDDPTALALLPDDDRADVEKHLAKPSRSFSYGSILARGAMMVARTTAIDDVVRAAGAPQVVVLGAGLDGRAWRMPELKDAVVFEVDHPDTQRDKKARVAALTQTAREVRFVAVDFMRDELSAALDAAGHDAAKPTTWIWEGVVMYLARRDIESTLAVVARRSAPGSRLAVLYQSPGRIGPIVGLFVRFLGEPIKSVLKPAEVAALLGRFGFSVDSDEAIPAVAARLSADLAARTRLMEHLRIVAASR